MYYNVDHFMCVAATAANTAAVTATTTTSKYMSYVDVELFIS